MSSPRWRKVLADLKVSRSRTILVLLSIAIGVFAIGAILTARVALTNGIDDSFDVANPASALLMTAPFDPSVVDAVVALPDVADAQGRAQLDTRLQGVDAWSNLNLHGIADFTDIRIDRLVPEEGAWPPATGELLLERLSLSTAGVAIGNMVIVEAPDGTQHTLRVGGTVYDPSQVDPSIGDGRLAGYISLETMAAMGQPTDFNELRIVAAVDPRNLEQGERVAGLARDHVLGPAGITVHRIAVQDTPRYHSALLGDALILILGLMGALILLLGVFLVINTVNALLAQQVRQIGVMKAIGGQRRQIAGVYLALVLAYGLLAAVIAVPLAALGAWAFAGYFAALLNINVSGPWVPPSVLAIQLALALLVPLLATLVPVMRGTRISVREAITSYGITESTRPPGPVGRAFERLRGIPRPVLLSLRNTFRRRGRLAMTLITLTLGGAMFASVATVQSSLSSTFDEVMQYSSYDVEVNLSEPQPRDTAVAQAAALPGVETAEGWIATNASTVRADGSQSSNNWLLAVPPESDLVRPTLIEGRWLQPGEEALVVNIDFKNTESGIGVGDTATLKVEGVQIDWPVVGIATSQLMGPVVYAPLDPFSAAIGMAGETNRIVLVTDLHDTDAQTAVAELADGSLRAEGLPIANVVTESDLRGGTQSAFNMLVVLLLIVGVLLVIVGSLGLMGAMSLNVIERTREIGVMRAIGASNRMLARIVIIEGLVVGLLSWLLGGLLAVPLSWALCYAIGVAFVQTPLSFAFSAIGLLLWLVLVVVLAVLASILPARGAWRLSVREVLAYE